MVVNPFYEYTRFYLRSDISVRPPSFIGNLTMKVVDLPFSLSTSIDPL
jgi:hypothetical protein